LKTSIKLYVGRIAQSV